MVTRNGKVYWKTGVDGHDSLHEIFKDENRQLDDSKDPVFERDYAPVEISPKNGNYIDPDEWIFKVDLDRTPMWLKDKHERLCWKAFEEWKHEVYGQIDIEGLRNFKNPLEIISPKKITKEHLKLLKEWDLVRVSVRFSVWASVWDSVRDPVGDLVGDSVWDSVRDSVGHSVGDSVWDSVRGSVGNSVRDSVGGNIGQFFPKITNWKHVDTSKKPYSEIKGYPFQSIVKLWKLGLVPSFDGANWRLHGYEDARVLWEGKI